VIRWWFAPLPAERLAGLRILAGGFALIYLVARLGHLLAAAHMPPAAWRPIGVVRWLCERPLDPSLWSALVVATALLALTFTLGVAHRLLAPPFAALLLFILTYRSSWTQIFHTENLLVLHVAVVALAPAADAWSLDRRRRARRGAPAAAPDGRYAWAVRTAAAVTVATYVLAGVAKLRISGLDWISGEQLRNQIAIDNLRKVLLGDAFAALATPLLSWPGLFAALAALTVAVELGAPLALRGGRVAAAWALIAWGFHVGVLLLMAIVFPYALAGIAFAPLFAVERPLAWVARKLGSSATAPRGTQ
jgi:hypothetical protein